MRRALRLLLVPAALAVAACGGSTVATQLGTVGAGAADIAAADLRFDHAELQVPAGMAVSLVFENREAAPHNVSIYADESADEALFVGEIFGGPGTRQYQLPALGAGAYFFRCDVHPDMRGTLVATP
jgi:plastocyanin